MRLAMVGASMSSGGGVMRAGLAVVRALTVTAYIAHIVMIYAYYAHYAYIITMWAM